MRLLYACFCGQANLFMQCCPRIVGKSLQQRSYVPLWLFLRDMPPGLGDLEHKLMWDLAETCPEVVVCYVVKDVFLGFEERVEKWGKIQLLQNASRAKHPSH